MTALAQHLQQLAASSQHHVLMLSHGIGGGVARHIHELEALLAGMVQVSLLEPVAGDSRRLRLILPMVDADSPAQELVFKWPQEQRQLARLLEALAFDRYHVHHAQGYPDSFWDFLLQADVPFDLTLHDHSIFTGHASLVNKQDVFRPEWLHQTLAQLPQGEQHLAHRLQQLALSAQRVLVPSTELYRAVRHLLPHVHEAPLLHRAHPDAECAQAYPQPQWRPLQSADRLTVLCLGMLGIEKGAHVLASVARAAEQQRLPVRFVLLGSCHVALPESVQRLGSYLDNEVLGRVTAVAPHVLWLPAQCPETWSYTLSTGMKLGLPVLTSAVGVFPERLQGRPLSWQLPLGATADEWLAQLLEIRHANLAAVAVPSWSWVPAPPFYTASAMHGVDVSSEEGYLYWCAQPPSRCSPLGQDIADLMPAWQRAQKTQGGVRLRVLKALSQLQTWSWIQPLVRRIPYRWQRALKRKISRAPLYEQQASKGAPQDSRDQPPSHP